jgi:hypothetical protein
VFRKHPFFPWPPTGKPDTADLLSDDVQAQKRIAQMIKHAHEQNEIPSTIHPGQVIDLVAFEPAGVI